MIARPLSIAGRLVLLLAAALIALWGTLALWYRLPLGETGRYAMPALWLVLAFLALFGLIVARWRLTLPFVIGFAVLLIWWSTIQPTGKGDWAPDVARQFTAAVEGSKVKLSNVRDFDWRSETDFTEHWEDRSYDLDAVVSVDFYASYWAGPTIAHTMVSFGFSDGRHLAFSVEVRRRRGQVYSAISGFFKENELVMIAADERDVIRLRSNVRGEDIQIFRLRAGPAKARELLVSLLDEANQLAASPRFYNTATTNCTTVPFKLARHLDPGLPVDWRILVTGYMPDYLRDVGSLNQDLPIEVLRERGRFAPRARAADQSPDFSALIRVGVPGP